MSTVLTKPRATESNKNPLTMFRREMEDLLSRFWDGDSMTSLTGAYMPKVDLVETDNAYEASVDLPGMQAKDIDVQVHGNTITISGTRKEEKSEKGRTFHYSERRSGSFARTLTLPCAVKEDEVAAEYTEGVLKVVLPKCEQERARRVSVKS